jgi:hypothetical protein
MRVLREGGAANRQSNQQGKQALDHEKLLVC